MRCPYCGFTEDKVVDSRETRGGAAIRRRRECLQCSRRFTTYERQDEIAFMVVKKDDRREAFDRNKLLSGLMKACHKRPVKATKLEAIVDEVEAILQGNPDKEISVDQVGAVVMERLKELDKVAFVRFASVYREFEDIGEFVSEVKELMD